ncbi:MAG: LuxR C-terminal-related transcriptional regulator [Treponema sp.]|nr:LuxR C-terminal-related transcriptional regulator [Treponema sp.]
MEAMLQTRVNLQAVNHIERSRLNRLFMEAVKFPLVVVCAGAGYGKTSAVLDFIKECQTPTIWMQITERDVVAERFWENYAHAWSQINESFGNAIRKIGFPDTAERQKQYLAVSHKTLSSLDRRIFVVDDIHNLENPMILRLSEYIFNNLDVGTTSILISRSTPRVNITGMISKGRVFNVSENDLRFTDNELSHYFRQLSIFPQLENLREIMQDTGGWAFAINLIARSYQKAPGYGGYLRSAMKTNIFQVMETEIWEGISERVQHFLVRISLIDHLSFDLIGLLAGGDEELINDMEQQNAYVRRDTHINAYLIHPLFLEFLSTKQDLLSVEEKRDTYAIAGRWCDIHGFRIDAMSYYEKIGDYTSIVNLFNTLPAQSPYDVAKYATTIIDRAPEEAFDEVVSLALAHVRCHMRLGLWERATELLEFYEAKYLSLPEGDVFRSRNLGGLYFLWGYHRNFMCLFDNVFDFDQYYEKFCKIHPNPAALTKLAVRSRVVGPWINANSSSKRGAPEEYIKAVERAAALLPQSFGGFMAGEDDIAWGELKFFQGDLASAEALLAQGLRKAQEHRQFELQHRALFYILRISVAQGNYTKGDKALKEIKAHLDEEDYPNRYINYDIAIAMSCYSVGLPEDTPDWLKQGFSHYSHASFIENYENQIKARYFYVTRNYPPLLAYIQEMKGRESYLYCRMAMLALEACVHYKMKDKKQAFAALTEAYETASPNDLIMPFIELGKDMRTLTASMLKESGSKKIPKAWLEGVNRKSASYAKRQAHVAINYKQANRLTDGVVLSPRETEILRDLSQGLSRAEIAASRSLSINTVKMVINNIYNKLGAENIADLIRIAVEWKLV